MNSEEDSEECELSTSGDNSQLSGVAMLAPSPDWFIGFYNVEMCDLTNNTWKTSMTGDLYGYDAGKRAGTTWALSTTTESTTIRKGIDLNLTGLTKENGLAVVKFGTYTIIKGVSILGLATLLATLFI